MMEINQIETIKKQYSNADKEVCIIAAWLHDIASITDYKLYKEHHIHGTIIADEIFLNKIQVEKMIYMED